jgi:inosine-uridine nucleoside N-ribohydrolase
MDHRTKLQTIGGLLFILLVIAGCSAPAATQKPPPTIPPEIPASPATPIPTPVPPTSLPLPGPTLTVEPNPPDKQVVLLYDDDGSRDGTVALLYLLGFPQISIKAISISYGEAHPDVYIQKIGNLLDHLGIQDIPLGQGQDAPLANGIAFPGWLRQLSDNFWDLPLPAPDKKYPTRDAAELIVSTINQSPQPVVIFLSGPFTNLAQAIHLDPGIMENIAAVYIMGGAVYAPGNITNLIPDSGNKVSEWNIIADPLAAKEVFDSGLQLYMVPLDATNQVILKQGDILPWHQGDEKANLSAELYDMMFESYGFESAEIFDLTAAVLMVNPKLCDFQPFHLDVVIDGGNNLGQTAVTPNEEPNIHACLKPDADRIKQELTNHFSGAE